MNTNEIKAVIDMVSDKITGGVQSVQPLAEEVVRQYAAKQGVLAIGACVTALVFAVIAVVGAVLAHKAYKAYKAATTESYSWEEDVCFAMILVWGLVTLIGGALAVSSSLSAVSYYSNMIAPLIGLMGK